MCRHRPGATQQPGQRHRILRQGDTGTSRHVRRPAMSAHTASQPDTTNVRPPAYPRAPRARPCSNRDPLVPAAGGVTNRCFQASTGAAGTADQSTGQWLHGRDVPLRARR
jgi:hypothetical protein